MNATQEKPVVYWISGSPYAWRVMLALEVKHVPYVSRLLDASKGELKTPEFLRLNARGRVPVLTHGEHVLTESLAILAYLDRQFLSPPLFGADALETARIWRLISEFVSYLHGPLNRVIAPLYTGKAAEKADEIRAALPLVHAELARLEQSLTSASWLGSKRPAAADIAIYPFVKSLERAAAKEAAAPFGLGTQALHAAYPGLAAWAAQMESLPGYERTYPPHWRALQPA